MRRSFSNNWLTALNCVLVGVVALGCNSRSSTPGSGAVQIRPREIYALGQLEPAGGIISISAIPGERLLALDPDVVENQHEPANGILGLLASYDLGKAQLGGLLKKFELAGKNRQHQIAVAEAQKKQAEASLAQAEAKLTELELQTTKLQALDVASRLASEEYAQLAALQADDSDLVTEHQLKKRENAMDTALAEFRIANDSYATTKEAADKTVTAAQANIDVANLTLKQLEQKFEEQGIKQEIAVAQETLKRSVLLSPSVSPHSVKDVLNVAAIADHQPKSSEDRGPLTVLQVFLRPGEFVTQMPIMQLGDLSEMVCVAEVYEADVKDLHIGQAAVIRSPAFAGKFADGIDETNGHRTGGMAGKIERIGNVIGSPGLANRNPLAPADRSVVEVRVAIVDPEAIAEAARRVGLQVTVEFAMPESQADTPNAKQ
jgi:HlyD family secretion protein